MTTTHWKKTKFETKIKSGSSFWNMANIFWMRCAALTKMFWGLKHMQKNMFFYFDWKKLNLSISHVKNVKNHKFEFFEVVNFICLANFLKIDWRMHFLWENQIVWPKSVSNCLEATGNPFCHLCDWESVASYNPTLAHQSRSAKWTKINQFLKKCKFFTHHFRYSVKWFPLSVGRFYNLTPRCVLCQNTMYFFKIFLKKKHVTGIMRGVGRKQQFRFFFFFGGGGLFFIIFFQWIQQ